MKKNLVLLFFVFVGLFFIFAHSSTPDESMRNIKDRTDFYAKVLGYCGHWITKQVIMLDSFQKVQTETPNSTLSRDVSKKHKKKLLSPDDDNDHDGVSNGLEVDGYYYDAKDGEFKPWNGDPNQKHFFTDPTQFSTDQDPYGDGMEVSGVKMEKSVLSPANHPLVPAYPDIYVKMTNYTVTPIETITSSTGKTAQTSWSNTTNDEKDSEYHWDVSGTVGVEVEAGLFGGTKGSASVTVSGGGRYGSKHTVTKSESGMDQQDWRTATTTDPSKAANIALNVNLKNMGTAIAVEIIPTLTLKLSDVGIKTYQMEHKILSLAPNEESGEYVSDNITVTLDVLRNIQMGIPLKIEIPQMEAKVKKADDHGGYTNEQKWSYYKPEIDDVCAHISINQRDGTPIKEYLVYATERKEDNGYGPKIKLKDMLSFILGGNFTYDSTTGKFTIKEIDDKQWALGISESAIKNITDQLKGDAKGNIMEVVIYQDKVNQWDITFSKFSEGETPQIQWAYYDPQDNIVTTYVTSFYGIKSVSFVDSIEKEYPMNAVGEIGVYTYKPTSTISGSEQIIAIDVRDKENKKNVSIIKEDLFWPMFMHDPQHTGRSKYKGAQQAIMKWQFKTEASVKSSPAIGLDNTIYVGSYDNYLYAIRPDGEPKWKFETGAAIYSSPAIGPDGTIYVGSFDHNFYAIGPNGELKWKYKPGAAIYSSPAIGPDGTIYVGSADYFIYAFKPEPENGLAPKWKKKIEGCVFSSPALDSDLNTIYVGCSCDRFYAIGSNDGQCKWESKSNTTYKSPAIGSDGTIYLGACDGFYAFQTNGELKWKYKDSTYFSSPAIGSDGTIYVGSKDTYIYAIHREGQEKWNFKTGGEVESSPAIGSDGTIYVGSNDTWIYAIQPDGILKWKFKTGGEVESSPAIGFDGTIYVGSNDGYLYAIREK